MGNVVRNFPHPFYFMVGSINYHRNVILKVWIDVLPSFRFLSVQTVSIFGHIARYVTSSADTLPSK